MAIFGAANSAALDTFGAIFADRALINDSLDGAFLAEINSTAVDVRLMPGV